MTIHVLNGCTASGKSSLAIELACRWAAEGHPCEIINADAMLVYRGMDIGTAKPTAEERSLVPHHLLDFLDVTEEASVADFQERARSVIANCHSRGVVPLVTGGSALYIHAIVDKMEFPGTDPALRTELEERADWVGTAAMYAELCALAPEAAAHIEPGNRRRIIRALEVVTLTGTFASQLPVHEYAFPDVFQWGIDVPRAVLDARIEERVAHMWASGLVDEVRTLEARGLRDARTASRAIGYRQVLAYLDGQLSQNQAREATVVATRRLARKQLSWFRRDPRIRWHASDDPAWRVLGLTAPPAQG